MKVKVTSNLDLIEWFDFKSEIKGKVLDYHYINNRVIYKIFDVDNFISDEIINKYKVKINYID